MSIIYLSDVTNDNKFISPVQMLRAAAADEIERGELPAKKAILITLDDGDGDYDSHFRCSNIKTSEVVSLLSRYVHEFIDHLRGKS